MHLSMYVSFSIFFFLNNCVVSATAICGPSPTFYVVRDSPPLSRAAKKPHRSSSTTPNILFGECRRGC